MKALVTILTLRLFIHPKSHPSIHLLPSSLSLSLFPPLSLDIKSPLQKHPNQTRIRNHNRSRQRLAKPRRPKNQPLAHKVAPSHGIGPHGELVKRGIIDIVRRVEAHQRREERPRPECAGRQRGYVFWGHGRGVDGGWVVDARGEGQGCVGLDAVSYGDYCDLWEAGQLFAACGV